MILVDKFTLEDGDVLEVYSNGVIQVKEKGVIKSRINPTDPYETIAAKGGKQSHQNKQEKEITKVLEELNLETTPINLQVGRRFCFGSGVEVRDALTFLRKQAGVDDDVALFKVLNDAETIIEYKGIQYHINTYDGLKRLYGKDRGKSMFDGLVNGIGEYLDDNDGEKFDDTTDIFK